MMTRARGGRGSREWHGAVEDIEVEIVDQNKKAALEVRKVDQPRSPIES